MRALISHNGTESALAKATGKDWKGKTSLLIYVLAISVAYWLPIIAGLLYAAVAIMWLMPDRRIEKSLAH